MVSCTASSARSSCCIEWAIVSCRSTRPERPAPVAAVARCRRRAGRDAGRRPLPVRRRSAARPRSDRTVHDRHRVRADTHVADGQRRDRQRWDSSTCSSTAARCRRRRGDRRRARTLLKRLVAARGHAVTRDELIDVAVAGRRTTSSGSVRDCRCSSPRCGGSFGVESWLTGRRSGSISTMSTSTSSDGSISPTTPRSSPSIDGDFLPDDRYEDWSAPLRDEIRARFVAASASARRAQRCSRRDRAVAQGDWPRTRTTNAAIAALVVTLRAEGRLGEARSAYQSYVAAMDDLGVPPTAWDELVP